MFSVFARRRATAGCGSHDGLSFLRYEKGKREVANDVYEGSSESALYKNAKRSEYHSLQLCLNGPIDLRLVMTIMTMPDLLTTTSSWWVVDFCFEAAQDHDRTAVSHCRRFGTFGVEQVPYRTNRWTHDTNVERVKKSRLDVALSRAAFSAYYDWSDSSLTAGGLCSRLLPPLHASNLFDSSNNLRRVPVGSKLQHNARSRLATMVHHGGLSVHAQDDTALRS